MKLSNAGFSHVRVHQREFSEFNQPTQLLKTSVRYPSVVESKAFEVRECSQVSQTGVRNLRVPEFQHRKACEVAELLETVIGNVSAVERKPSQMTVRPQFLQASIRDLCVAETEHLQIRQTGQALQTGVSRRSAIEVEGLQLTEAVQSLQIGFCNAGPGEIHPRHLTIKVEPPPCEVAKRGRTRLPCCTASEQTYSTNHFLLRVRSPERPAGDRNQGCRQRGHQQAVSEYACECSHTCETFRIRLNEG